MRDMGKKRVPQEDTEKIRTENTQETERTSATITKAYAEHINQTKQAAQLCDFPRWLIVACNSISTGAHYAKFPPRQTLGDTSMGMAPRVRHASPS